MVEPIQIAKTPTRAAPRRIMAMLVVSVAVVSGGFWSAARAAAETRPLTILTLSSYHSDLPFARAVEAGIRAAVTADNVHNQVFFEYLDSTRFELGTYDDAFAALLDQKYGGIKPDAVILWADAAVGFADAHWNTLHSNRVIAMEVEEGALARLRHHDASAIMLTVPSETDLAIQSALTATQPRSLVLLGDSSGADQIAFHAGFLDAWRTVGGNVQLVDLFDVPLDEILSRVAKLPADSTLYYGLIFKDERGAPVRPADVAARITAVATAPMFSQWDTLMGRGIVGGRMMSGRLMGRVAALAALADAQGSADALAQALRQPVHVNTFDGTQLQRWGIPENRLPPESVVVNRPPDIWFDYREYVLAGGAAVIMLSALSFLLARSLRARDRAVAALGLERAGLAERVEERTAELARSNAELESFAYAIAHDLRAPLRAISGYARLLDRSAKPRLNAEELSFVATITDAAQRMDGLIQGLLEYARVGRGDGALTEPVDVAAAVADVIEMIQAPICHPDATITCQISPAVTTVMANPTNFNRLLQNLLENALKYRDPTRPPVVGVTADIGPQGELRLAVSDNGIGIPDTQWERIFGLFQSLTRQDPLANGPSKGFGVGLALCRRIVDALGGRIWIDSTVGEGSTFHVALPLGTSAVQARII